MDLEGDIMGKRKKADKVHEGQRREHISLVQRDDGVLEEITRQNDLILMKK